MAEREIREIPDPVLRTKCDPIGEVDDGVRGLVADLLDTVDQEGRAGLAANQIGVSLAAFSWHVDDEVGYVINPKLVELSEETEEQEEGCLSVPGLWYPTVRSRYARVEGTDLEGNPVTVEGTGIMARCLQHEMDHLAGKLFLDRLERGVRARAMRELRERL
ncbi:MAG: peptide deformylase [Promicromonosporaceae bacterium]|nr:peptide deformylase [Promicromonosporaceae bacterium]